MEEISFFKKVRSYFPTRENKIATSVETEKKPEMSAQHVSDGAGYRSLFAVSYTGEKNLGEIGPIKDYRPHYEILRLRSWQSYLESEISQTVINRFVTWVIGKGLKLQAEPVAGVLRSENINVDTHAFSEAAEARFNIFRQSEKSDFSEMENLDILAETAYKNAIVGGDVLVILRYVNDCVNVQLVDGAHVQSPQLGTESYPQSLETGNRIINGIEVDKKGKHIKYYVRNSDFSFSTVECKCNESGLQIAFLVYGLRYRLNNVRGLPLVATVLETLKKLERYKEATVGSAEERQKIAFSIEHELGSTGENPLIQSMAKALNYGGNTGEIPEDINGKQLSDLVTATTNKQAINLPINSKLKMLESKNELYFKDFYSVNIDLVCASLGIPPEVAMSKYDSNFSASRAALKDWEHTLIVKRHSFSFQFYQKIYNFWLETEILKNKIAAPGYLIAKRKNDFVVLDAYRMARFVGAPVPHIDPLKEAKAERAKLGANADAIPLTTVEAATESLNGGEADANMKQFAVEIEKAKKLKIILPPVETIPATNV